MQLHHLTLSAIGPFADTFYVNFQNLAASGLFLLEGPTGTGKSTIIDAIVFGLYGKVASADTSDDRMRSDHASDATESWVDLVFETSQGIYRVVRKPERLRPKKRGTGVIKEQASVRLYRLAVADLEAISQAFAGTDSPEHIAQREYGQIRSTRLDEAGLELTHIIGLTREQFVQTIVLPQGQFAQFLKANPEDRRALLQRVFGTEIYERAQDELAAMKRDATKTIEHAQARRAEAIRAFVQDSDTTELSADALIEAPDDDVAERVKDAIDHMRTRQDDTEQAEINAVTTELLAREAHEHAKLRALRHTQRAQARLEREQLEHNAPRIREQEVTLNNAVRASYVTGAARQRSLAESARNTALNVLVKNIESAQEYAELGPIQGDLSTDSPSSIAVFARSLHQNRNEIEQERSHAQLTLGTLKELKTLEQGLQARTKNVEELRARAERQTKRIAELDESLTYRPAQLAELHTRREELHAHASQVDALAQKITTATRLVELHNRATSLEKQLAAAQAAATTATIQAQNAATAETQLRNTWLAGLAGQLAQELEDGTPCAVCGSTEHPMPALSEPDAPTKQDVEKAEQHRNTMVLAATKAAGALAAAQEQVTGIQSQLGGTTAEQAATDLATAQADLDSAKRAAVEAKKLTTEIATHESDTKKLESDRTRQIAELAEVTAKIDVTAEHIANDSNAVASELQRLCTSVGQPFEDLAHAEQFLTHRVDSIATLLTSLDQFTTAQNSLDQRDNELNVALAEQQFTDVRHALDAELEPAERTRLSAAITAHSQQLATVTTLLASPEFADIPEELDVDPSELKTLHESALSALKIASVHAERAKAQLRSAQARWHTIEREVQALGSQREQVLPIIRMADIATGNSTDNAQRVTLATYVLLRRFEDVLAAANTRLLALSDGRYELERSEHKEDVKSRKRGLALQVIDHNTDKPRDPRTLSGGETFNASLSLALGLADVVTAEAGGVELGTLFIDEGFGTLDSEALEKVLTVLSALREGGRTVGVVSHVETLKQSISDGISVRRTQHGTSTLTVRV